MSATKAKLLREMSLFENGLTAAEKLELVELLTVTDVESVKCQKVKAYTQSMAPMYAIMKSSYTMVHGLRVMYQDDRLEQFNFSDWQKAVA